MQGHFVIKPDTLRELTSKAGVESVIYLAAIVWSDLSETPYGSQLAKSSKTEASSSPLLWMTVPYLTTQRSPGTFA